MLKDLGRREEAILPVEEALELVLPTLERAHYFLHDSGASLLVNYLELCNGVGRRPPLQIVLRMQAVLISAGLISGDHP